jgi:hypothetical protein
MANAAEEELEGAATARVGIRSRSGVQAAKARWAGGRAAAPPSAAALEAALLKAEALEALRVSVVQKTKRPATRCPVEEAAAAM